MLKGIDVSVHNNIIDWTKVKSQIDFAILRIGYGDNINYQDDKMFYENLQNCIDNNIKFGVYLYSYATDYEHLDSEILHTKRILESINVKPFCVYFDMEDNSTEFLGEDTLTEYALTFCREIKKLGYKTGVYANQNWFNNFLDCKKIHDEGNSIWVAKYSNNKPNIPTEYDIWQYTSDGVLEGINGRVDMNYMYKDLISENKPASATQPINNKVNIYSQGYTKEDGWLPQVKNNTDYVGWKNHSLRYLALKVDKGSIKYRVTTVSGKTLGWVTGYNINDLVNGCAGNGEPIATVEVYFYTPDNIRPYKKAKYKVNDYDWQYDLETSNGQDGYAGVKGVVATKFQIEII
jgi:GH25 family lysozyme M1 (1,4-beta-N-acetylmuramidase)